MKVLTQVISGKKVTLTQQMAKSGEGTIWHTNVKNCLAKLYHQPTPERIEKLQIMIANPPWDPMRNHNHITFAWPQDLLQDSKGNYVGFLMPLVEESVKLSTIYNPRLRSRKAPQFNWYYLHTTALNIALALQSLHREGYVVGDIKPQNLLVNNQALVSIIDTDSFQVPNPYTRAVYRCLVGSEGFTPPELLGQNLSDLDQNEVHDRFRLGVTLYLLLFGDQPFKGKWMGNGDSPPPSELIRKGYWPFAPKSLIEPGPHTIPLSVVHPAIQQLFRQCFTQGHHQPDARPTAEAWVQVLDSARKTLVKCKMEPNHFHISSQEHKTCYWCDRKATLGMDIFNPDPPKPVQASVQRTGHPSMPPKAPKAPKAPNLRVPGLGHFIYTAQKVRSSQIRPIAACGTNFHTSTRPNPLNLRGLPHLSNTAIGSILCVFSLLGLGLLLLPADLDIGKLANWSPPVKDSFKPWRPSPSPTPSATHSHSSPPSTAAISSLLAQTTISPRQGHWDAVTTLAISPDGQTLASGSRDFTIKIWDLATGTLVRTLSNHYEPIISVNIPESGNTLISSSSSGKIILWNLQTGQPLKHLGKNREWGAKGAIRSAVANAQGTVMAASAWGGRIKFHHLQTDRVTTVTSDSIASEQAIAISPDAQTVVSSSNDGKLSLWDVKTSTLKRRFPDAKNWEMSEFTNSLAMSSDGTHLASGGWDGSIRLWDMQTGQRLQTFSGHDKFIAALAFNSDNSLIVSGSDDHQIKIWEVQTGKQLRTLIGHQDSIIALAVSRDGQFLVSGSEDQTLKIWNFMSGKLLHTLSSR